MGETGGFGGAGEQAAPSPEPARLLTTANNDRDLDGHDHYYAPQERPVRIHRFSSVLYQSDSKTRLMRRVLQRYAEHYLFLPGRCCWHRVFFSQRKTAGFKFPQREFHPNHHEDTKSRRRVSSPLRVFVVSIFANYRLRQD
jgi:hypothetical protein